MTTGRRLLLGLALILAIVAGLVVRHVAASKQSAREAAPLKPVHVVQVAGRPFQPSHTYVGTFEPWLAANVGPQLVSAYIDSVEVRPGAVVKRGDLLAKLDCREAHASSQAVASETHAVEAREKALAAESSRFQDLLAKHFVSPNEAQMKAAASSSEAARLEAQRARLSRSSLEVGDCILRAPFDGEVATRTMDPGGYVRPGAAIVSIVDRATVRFSADVPEIDFDRVAAGTPVRITVLATRRTMWGAISRRAPAADPATRTVHFEVDLADPNRSIPVGTTGEARIVVGEPEPASAIPVAGATVRGDKAQVFVVEDGVARAHAFLVKGEVQGWLYVDPALAAGREVVTDGRALIAEGDHLATTRDPDAPPPVETGSTEQPKEPHP